MSNLEITLLPTGEAVSTLLASQGINVGLGCGQGTCGMCKVRYISGPYKYTEVVLATLYPDEIVSCCAIPAGPLVILV